MSFPQSGLLPPTSENSQAPTTDQADDRRRRRRRRPTDRGFPKKASKKEFLKVARLAESKAATGQVAKPHIEGRHGAFCSTLTFGFFAEKVVRFLDGRCQKSSSLLICDELISDDLHPRHEAPNLSSPKTPFCNTLAGTQGLEYLPYARRRCLQGGFSAAVRPQRVDHEQD